MKKLLPIALRNLPAIPSCGIFPVYHFHVSRDSRKRYSFRRDIFSTSGNVIFADFGAARDFAAKMNLQFQSENSNRYARPGDIYAMGLIDEILHHVFHIYKNSIDPLFLQKTYSSVANQIGGEKLFDTLKVFASEFPPLPVHDSEKTPLEHLTSSFEGTTGALMEFEEMILLRLANENPAFEPYRELFSDTVLSETTAYIPAFEAIEKNFRDSTGISAGGVKHSLIDLLRAPMRASPDSLSGQLRFIKENWGFEILGDFSKKLLTSMDIIKEEHRPVFGPGSFGGEMITKESLASTDWNYDEEFENFSTDSSWMPRVIMIAKNVFVWLEQLSRSYAREIKTLDQIPNDELKTLAQRGFTALWLIGLWERSRASKQIKQMTGNPDAVASAYSLFDYSIAKELGGSAALENLKERAWKFGIRLASDMVPNHMAVDSKWVYEHPEWFLSLKEPPFPGYSYNGENLSSDPDIEIYIEDHYFDKTDAAVTFKRVDRKTGEVLYVYHGNDGTCMPWNDTAQLNYLREDVREHVMKTIIGIAKTFPVIRFDAAMTLAKRHYHRLWFPEPGKGGDIASRAEHGMTKEEFNNLFPKEFWREVVDRVASEAPDTLLLAEAFWLMEGYFVRTLGMHRVYNSAFMNFMKNEDNAKYRQSIKNILEFDPQILERHVNFLNNPDEETAVKQFGDGDKYFGVTLSMVTMPGLPMFGHGQVEGFSEKYGMEYKKAYWNESVNWGLVSRHEKDIFPLMHKRKLFAHVEHFHLFDLYLEDGSVDENVFAYSNGSGDERVLVFYHNRFAETSGWIKASAEFLNKSTGRLEKRELDYALGLSCSDNFVVFRDSISGLQYIKKCSEISRNGFFVKMNAYKYFVFCDFREVSNSSEEPWAELCDKLNGESCADLKTELDRIRYRKLHDLLKEFVNPDTFEKFVSERKDEKKKNPVSKFYRSVADRYQSFISELSRFEGVEEINRDISDLFIRDLIAVIDLPRYKLKDYDLQADNYLQKNLSANRYYLFMVLGFAAGARLSMIRSEVNDGPESNRLFRKYGLEGVFSELFEQDGMTSFHSRSIVKHIRAFIYYQNWWRHHEPEVLPLKLMEEVFSDANMMEILQINEYEGVTWFNREAFEDFLAGLFVISVLEILRNIEKVSERKKEFKYRFTVISDLIDAASRSGYRVEVFLQICSVNNV